jgi:hypothetical protein
MGSISLRVVRVSTHISQNAAAEAVLVAELFGVELALAAEVLLGAEVLAGAEVLLGAGLAQADSIRAAVIDGMASNPSRPAVRDVRSMPL